MLAGSDGLSPAMIVACIALARRARRHELSPPSVLAPRNSVGSNQVIDHSLPPKDFQTPSKGPAAPQDRQARRPGRPRRRRRPGRTEGRLGDRDVGVGRPERHARSEQGRRVRAEDSRTGEYQVVFNQDVTGCSYQATLGGPTTGV